jgi:hypothetical protein
MIVKPYCAIVSFFRELVYEVFGAVSHLQESLRLPVRISHMNSVTSSRQENPLHPVDWRLRV